MDGFGQADGDELLPGDVGRIAQVAGLEAAIKIAIAFKGAVIYINSLEALFREARNERIRVEYSGGMPVRRLALKYGLTDRAVRKVLGTVGTPIEPKIADLVERYWQA